MEYTQVKFSRLICPTTCYSGIRDVSEHGSGFLATESDLIQYSSNNEITGSSLRKIIKPPLHGLPCVGHSSLKSQQAFVFLQKKNHNLLTSTSQGTLQTSEARTSLSNRSQNISIVDDALASESILTATIPVTSTAANTNTTTQQQHASDASDESLDTSILMWKDVNIFFRIDLPCRLLAPTLCQVKDGVYLLWAGSADDSELRCFQILQPQGIQTVPISDGMTTSTSVTATGSGSKLEAVTSPIMSIDCYSCCNASSSSEEPLNSLAIGCQDGTVCILNFTHHRMHDRITSLEIQTTHTIIVDGPIMSLHLTKTMLLLGSMCGYACELSFTGNVWGEPNMVVQDFLSDARHEEDDAVLAVKYWMDRVVLGTYSGLVQVHVRLGPPNNPQYAVEWSCRFHDAIHAIASYQNKLIITTRTSIVILEAKAMYSAERAKHRLQKILDTNRLSLF